MERIVGFAFIGDQPAPLVHDLLEYGHSKTIPQLVPLGGVDRLPRVRENNDGVRGLCVGIYELPKVACENLWFPARETPAIAFVPVDGAARFPEQGNEHSGAKRR
jgi:hypothetical protein